MASQQFVCASWSEDNPACKKFGNYTCKNCLLVVYCSSDCQKSHWALHKIDCKSPLGKKTWNPDWVLEERTPAFIGPGLASVFGMRKYLWGNIPALDLLQLGANEGEDYGGRLNLLFAASGDLRNVVKTISQLPSGYNNPMDVTINDRDMDIVARNAIMLLIALVANNVDEAIDCIIHVWYSAIVRKSDIEMLQQRILPLVKDMSDKIKGKESSKRLGRTWTFGQRSLKLVLQKSSWERLLAYMELPEGLTAERANRIRKAVTLAESRKDYRDRNLLFQSPSRRVAKHRFRQDGILLPFGSPRHEFQEPNPTFFQTADAWPMNDDADPLGGWSLEEVEGSSSGPATADIYGKLFYYIRALLRTFLLRLSDLKISFRLFQEDFCDLPKHLARGSFSRIEVSNISDTVYVGVHSTVALMAPLLQGPLTNPHATLITLFMNAVEEIMTDEDRISEMRSMHTLRPLLEYLSIRGMPTDGYSPETIKLMYARSLLTTHDYLFNRFMNVFHFSEIENILGVEMKQKHTIIDKWPFRLKLRVGQPGAQEEFDRLAGGSASGKERYVEWQRTCVYKEEFQGQSVKDMLGKLAL